MILQYDKAASGFIYGEYLNSVLDVTKTYEFDSPIPQYKHVCAFAASPEDLDKHFESKYPDHKVVESLESRLKPKELPKPVTKSWF
jgi:hypothetical protein